jgi:hypothetical protein
MKRTPYNEATSPAGWRAPDPTEAPAAEAAARFVVITTVTGQTNYLRGTAWTLTRERADTFASRAAAEAALAKMKRVTPASARAAFIVLAQVRAVI